MTFEQFKKEWKECMVYRPQQIDVENLIHDLYVEYKGCPDYCYISGTIEYWCELRFSDYDLYRDGYMLKKKALQTHHGNGLIELANKFRNRMGLDEIKLNKKG